MQVIAPMSAEVLSARHHTQAERVRRAVDAKLDSQGAVMEFRMPMSTPMALGHRMVLRYAIQRQFDWKVLFLAEALVRLGPMTVAERRRLGFTPALDRVLISEQIVSEGPTRTCVISGSPSATMRIEPRTSDGMEDIPRSISALPPSIEDVGAYLGWIAAIGEGEQAVSGDRSDGSSESAALASYFTAMERGWSCSSSTTLSRKAIRSALDELKSAASRTSCRVGDFPGTSRVLSWLSSQDKLPGRLVMWPELHLPDRSAAPAGDKPSAEDTSPTSEEP